jgi:hypothetical protein
MPMTVAENATGRKTFNAVKISIQRQLFGVERKNQSTMIVNVTLGIQVRW